jgi:hypothetical protein
MARYGVFLVKKLARPPSQLVSWAWWCISVIPAVLEEEYRIVIQTGLGKKVRLLYEK